MTAKQASGARRRLIRFAVVGAILLGVLTTTATPINAIDRSVDGTEPDTDEPSDPADVVDAWIEHRRMNQLVAAMPPGWPATEVMRRAANAPFGETADRARWRRDAELMPSEWPASHAMRLAAGASTEADTVAAFGFRNPASEST